MSCCYDLRTPRPRFQRQQRGKAIPPFPVTARHVIVNGFANSCKDGSEMRYAPDGKRAFTLIEMSIVLVVIGLIVGGVLVGEDLIRAAAVRATISQIEKYQTAVNTFRGKYGYLPGDIKDPEASQFGFAPRGQYVGEGNGDGVIEGIDADAANQADPEGVFSGELAMFWVDLSKAGLIDGTLNTATPTAIPGNGINIGSYVPHAKIGPAAYVYIWQGGWPVYETIYETGPSGDDLNYFAIAGVTGNNVIWANTAPAFTVAEAYAIDKKIDDGLPQGGTVMAMDGYWWASGVFPTADADPATAGPIHAGDGVATAPSSTTCYDNASIAGATEQYSMGTNGGSGLNCSLSFRFQ